MKICILFLLFPFISFASEKDVYDFEWLDDDKKIYVLQNRKYRKVGKVSLGVMGTFNLSDKFVNNLGGSIKGAYYFKEDWGIEAGFLMGRESYNATFNNVASQRAVPFFNTIKQAMNLSLVWSPFYGKFNTFNKIFYLDWYISAGLASLTTKDDREAFNLTNTADIIQKSFNLTESTSVGATWSTGLLWYLSKGFSLRAEITGYHYNGAFFTRELSSALNATETSILFHNYNMSMGLNFLF